MEPLEDVLYVHNGVIDQRTDGNGHTAQAHGVDGEVHQVEHHQRGNHGQRNSDQRDNRGAQVAQEEYQDEDHEDTALQDGALYVAYRAFNEAALAEDVGMNLDVAGQVFL